ncbi:Endoplasmic reticulum resident protein 29 [Dermatophagoides pteronyssinus]|uniref:Endoplasmic reticulum resident protein 29 n=1 Tax=Dermatophagoides pteronyssinus TaxID=6956 RepID=A0ABQ8IRE0_DERPT|nr:Endoplasmic reticulum resident protein 29 [Dermatophagoides pteronyssinus]
MDQYSCQHSLGVVELDQYTFDLIASRFRYVLTKFDHLYSYGPNQNVFNQLALDTMKMLQANQDGQDILFLKDIPSGKINFQQSGYSSIKIQIRIGRRRENIEHFKSIKPIRYPIQRRQQQKILIDSTRLRLFLKKFTQIQLPLSNCTEYLDQFAREFIQTFDSNDTSYLNEQQNKIIVQMESILNGLSDQDKRKQTMEYLKWMKYGQKFKTLNVYEQQHKRLTSILWNDDNKIDDQKRQQLQLRFNILQSFRLSNDYADDDDDDDDDATIDIIDSGSNSRFKEEF